MRFAQLLRGGIPMRFAQLLRGRSDPVRELVERNPDYIILPSTGTISSATMLMILINGLIAGPAVSL